MAIACSLTDSAVDGTNASTYTFTARSLGAATADRYIIVPIGASLGVSSSTAISSVTVAGISATQIASAVRSGGSGSARSEIWIAAVPAGTTGNIVVTFAAGVNDCGIGVLRATGLNSATAFDTANATTNNTNMSIDVEAGGLLVAGSVGLSSGSPTTVWTNAAEAYDAAIEASAGHSGAFDVLGSAQTGRQVKANWSGGVVVAGPAVCATFTPAPSAIVGTLSATLADATLAAAATVQIKAALAKTLGDATLSATGSVGGTGQLAATLANVTIAAAAKLAIAGTLSKTLANVTLSSAATVKIVGALAVTLANATLSSAAAVQIKAALAATLADASLSSAAQLKIQAVLAATLDDATLASIAQSVIHGDLSVTLEDAVLIATGNDGWTRRGNAGGSWTNVPPASGIWTPVSNTPTTWTPQN